jgi:hypothetical protein
MADGACTDLFENLNENSIKGDLSNDNTINPPLFSLVSTFKKNRKKSLEKYPVSLPLCWNRLRLSLILTTQKEERLRERIGR